VLYYTDNGTKNYDSSMAYGKVFGVQYTIQAHTKSMGIIENGN
jgi:hypothetical protein